ncbi:hypothetical protein A1D11_18505 [Bacillus subtilis subsp. globigii]|nr:hypothetical protein A1D11_18505 [Bacillus subtilis subsp. globigii]EIM09932.1 teichoic acid s permease [Bacillus atrophaeus C89]
MLAFWFVFGMGIRNSKPIITGIGEVPFYFFYLICMIVFMFSFSLFNSTVSVLVRDYHFLLQAVTRLLFFLLPVFWNISEQLGNNHPKQLLRQPIVLQRYEIHAIFLVIHFSFINSRFYPAHEIQRQVC